MQIFRSVYSIFYFREKKVEKHLRRVKSEWMQGTNAITVKSEIIVRVGEKSGSNGSCSPADSVKREENWGAVG